MPERNGQDCGDEAHIHHFAVLLRHSRRIVFLTGAGMSTESGIPDFRSASGIYATGGSAEAFDVRAFEADPTAFFDIARGLFAEIADSKPNRGHLAITALQNEFRKTVDVVTQNIDTLHQQAGTRSVHPIHGTVETVTCTRCRDPQYADTVWPSVEAGRIPLHTKCGGVYKPDIVFFGEMLPVEVLMASQRAVEQADLVVVLGTSLTVYPAAALPSYRHAGVPLVIINRAATAMDVEATLVFHDSIGEILGRTLTFLRSAHGPQDHDCTP